MTNEERSKYYQAREAYHHKCEDFKEEMFKYLSTYEQRMQKPKIRLVP
ncbi:MAG: hypothetical protein IKM85_06715 [Bacteroidales bacterium]|nr:hypothetical protein [Bacteroidales bacterium]